MWGALLGIGAASVALAVLHQTLESVGKGEGPPKKPGQLAPPDTSYKPSPGGWRRGGWGRHDSVACRGQARAQAAPEVEDQTVHVRCMLAESSGRLDLSDCELSEVPAAVLELTDLEELSLSGNHLTTLPEGVSRLTRLRRLQLAGNRLEALPPGLGALAALEGLWLHGNLLRALPDSLGALSSLRQLSLAGNRLEQLPDSLGALAALTELGVAGNRLRRLPAALGALPALAKLAAHGNALEGVPPELGAAPALQELWLQGNPGLAALPPELGALPALRHLSAADCGLTAVPASLGAAPALETLSLYGNPRLAALPPTLLAAPRLQHLWAEGCPLAPEAVEALLLELAARGAGDGASSPSSPSPSVGPSRPAASAAASASFDGNTSGDEEAGPGSWALKTLGLDASQVARAAPALVAAAGRCLRVSEVVGASPGYWKLEAAPRAAAATGAGAASAASAAIAAETGGGEDTSGQAGGAACRPPPRAEVLVVAFGSAPGTPNWGGLLARVRRGAASPAEAAFDVLYVVDSQRGWYGGGDEATFRHYERQLAAAAARYPRVVLLGDSMGATAALLFAPLATSAQAFCPQVDLRHSSIRPGAGNGWFAALQARALAGAAACPGEVVVHTGTWQHDLDQARCLPETGPVRLQVYNFDSHRLALYLDRRGQLERLVRGAVLRAQGLADTSSLRLANLF
eukprot:scaffold15.g4206.t1